MTIGVLGAVAQCARSVSGRPLRVVGVSDGAVLSATLTRMFGERYQNHQLHEPPFLNLLSIEDHQRSSADIVTCSDVLEHVPNPVSRAFVGLREVLAADGVAVLSVPHGVDNPHQEHFPRLSEARVVRTPSQAYVYTGVADDGSEASFGELVFHGGEGETLEHRVFSAISLAEELTTAGFKDPYPLMRDLDFLGAAWEPWSRVWLATK